MISKSNLLEAYKNLGIKKGDCLLIHLALSAFPFVVGGAETVLEALKDSVKEEGTLVFPYQFSDRLELAHYPNHFSLNDINAFRKIIRGSSVHSLAIGASKITELLLRENASLCGHPVFSYVVEGYLKEKLASKKYDVDFPFGPNSLLDDLRKNKAKVLLMGVDYSSATFLHLPQSLSFKEPIQIDGCPICEDEEESFISYLDFDYSESKGAFLDIGSILEKNNLVEKIYVGKTKCTIFNMYDAFRVGLDYFLKK